MTAKTIFAVTGLAALLAADILTGDSKVVTEVKSEIGYYQLKFDDNTSAAAFSSGKTPSIGDIYHIGGVLNFSYRRH